MKQVVIGNQLSVPSLELVSAGWRSLWTPSRLNNRQTNNLDLYLHQAVVGNITANGLVQEQADPCSRLTLSVVWK